MSKILALHSGGDWADASAEYLVLPDGLSIEAEAKAYQRWYRDEYCVQLRAGDRPKYRSLFVWLLEKGAREPRDDELEIYDDT